MVVVGLMGFAALYPSYLGSSLNVDGLLMGFAALYPSYLGSSPNVDGLLMGFAALYPSYVCSHLGMTLSNLRLRACA